MLSLINQRSLVDSKIETIIAPVSYFQPLATHFSLISQPRSSLVSSPMQLRQPYMSIEAVENKKVPNSRLQPAVLVQTCVHIVAILGAVVIISLNLSGTWIGKELQGQVSADGQKLFALQLTAKAHELLMFASLSHIVWSMLQRRLSLGAPVPFGSLGAALRFQDGSYVFSREFRALCTAKFGGKTLVLFVITLSMLLAVIAGPSSATAMVPILDDWPAGDTYFTINATEDQLWPNVLTNQSMPRFRDAAWTNIENNLFSYWGHQTLGGILAAPETVAIPSTSSVRTLDVRLRGPFSLFQPEHTAVSVQNEVVADATNNVRLAWYRDNVQQCAWARSRITGGQCMYKDIQWTVRALQPVVYTRCLQNKIAEPVMFPTLALGNGAATDAPVSITATFGGSDSAAKIRWANLEEQAFAGTSVGALIQTRALSDTNTTESYACSIDAQWAFADVATTFLGTPYAVTGFPPGFFARNISASPYEGWRVKIEPEWAILINPILESSSNKETVFDRLIGTGAPVHGPSKVEAVIGVLVAQAMASLKSDAVIQGNLSDSENVLKSVISAAKQVVPGKEQYQFKLETSVTGYAYGVRSANSISISSLMSVIVLCCYAVFVSVFVILELCSRRHVISGHNFTDLLTLALHSSPGPRAGNSSAGRNSIDTLRLPVFLAANGGSPEMIIGQRRPVSKTDHEGLGREQAF